MTFLDDPAIARLRDAAMWPSMPGDRYQDLRRLARGGMGTVYAARDTRLGRDVAIKVSNTAIPAERAAASAAALDARLASESTILARLEHPGIVPVHDAGVLEDGRAFYVMKLVNGRTLDESRASVIERSDQLAILERVVETVAFAHSAGVVHRDLKPANIILGAFGEVLVLDWGVARVIDAHVEAGDADRGMRMGTPGFMAPEQQSGGAANAGPTADVYALGTLMHWMIGEQPRPKRLQAIIDRCRAPNPADRYPSAARLGEDLAKERAGLPVSAYQDTWFDRASAWFARHRVFIGLIAAYLLMRVAFLVFQR